MEKYSEEELKLVPISEEDLESAYGCSCAHCRLGKGAYGETRRCCYKDCYHITSDSWDSFISTSQ